MRKESPPPSSFQAREEPWRLEKSTLHLFMISLAVQNLIVRLCCHPLGIERQSVLLSRLRRQVKERNQAFDENVHTRSIHVLVCTIDYPASYREGACMAEINRLPPFLEGYLLFILVPLSHDTIFFVLLLSSLHCPVFLRFLFLFFLDDMKHSASLLCFQMRSFLGPTAY